MKSRIARLAAMVLVVGVIAGWWLFHRGSGESVDLMAQFATAQEEGITLRDR